MEKIKCRIKAIFSLCFLSAPVLLIIIGICVIYNIDLLTGLVIGLIGCAGVGFEFDLTLKEIKTRITTK